MLALDEVLDSATPGDPRLCVPARDLNVEYVLDFGLTNVSGDVEQHPGLDDLANAPAPELMDSQGDARLYRLIGCS